MARVAAGPGIVPASMKSGPVLPLAVLATLAVLVALPLAFVVLQAVFPAIGRASFAHPFSAFSQTLARPDTLPLFANTVRFGLAVALASLLLGVPLGVVRGLFRVPGARARDWLFLAPFLIPPYLAALGWMLLQPRGYLDQILGINLGHFLFSFDGVVAAMTLSVFPIVYFSVSRALATLGARLADVARVFGAGPWRSFMRVTLPLILPSITASALLAFTMSIEEFGIPAALGSRAGRDVETHTGKPAAAVPRELGGWRWPILAAFGCVACVATLAPLFAIVVTAFARTLSGGLAGANLTLAHFRALGSGEAGAQALETSLALAAGTAILTGGLGFLSAWCVVKTRMRGRAALDALTLLPHALPSIVVGVGLILAWNLPIWPVTPYDTWGILLLSYSCLLLPYPVRYTNAALRQLGGGLEAAARVHGASAGRVLVRIVMPLVAPALVSSMLIVFAIASRELVTSLLLAPSGVQTASIFIWQQFEQGSIGDGMAMGTVTILVSGAMLGIGARWASRFNDSL